MRSGTPCDVSGTVSASGQTVASMRPRSSLSACSGTSTRNGRALAAASAASGMLWAVGWDMGASWSPGPTCGVEAGIEADATAAQPSRAESLALAAGQGVRSSGSVPVGQGRRFRTFAGWCPVGTTRYRRPDGDRMITVEELRGIRILSELPDAPLAYLSGAVEDIRVAAGEYFANEGDERALFVVVEGRAEMTKVVAGEERVIGIRKPGQFFGEVPMTLSAPFPASGRAAEASRIIKLDVTVYYTLAALAPVVPTRVAFLARRYLESLQELAVEQPASEIQLIGPRQDPRTHEVAGFLARNQIGIVRLPADPADGEAEYPVLQTAAGRLVAPSMR